MGFWEFLSDCGFSFGIPRVSTLGIPVAMLVAGCGVGGVWRRPNSHIDVYSSVLKTGSDRSVRPIGPSTGQATGPDRADNRPISRIGLNYRNRSRKVVEPVNRSTRPRVR